MPEASRPGLIRRIAAEWPLLGAAAALLSLLWLPRHLPDPASYDKEQVEILRSLIHREPEAVEEGARDFLRRAPDGPWAAEVHAIRGEAALRRLESGQGPASALARLAWDELSAAREQGHRPDAMAALRRRVAGALRDAAALREILAKSADPDLAFSLALARAGRAARRPAEAPGLVAEMLAVLDGAREQLPPERRVEAPRAAARLARRAGRAEDALPRLLQAVDAFPTSVDRGLLQIECGRSLAALDRSSEALAALERAAELLQEAPASRPELAAALLEVRVRNGPPDDPGLLASLEAAGGELRARGRLLAAAGRLAVDRPRGLRELAEALADLPALRPLEEAGLDLPWIKRALRAAAGAEEEPAALAHASLAFGHFFRLEPEDVRLLLDRAGVLRRAGRHGEAGEVFQQAAEDEALELPERERAAREGADALVRAERFAAAARLYRRWHAFSPRRNAEGLLLQARSLRRARLPGAADVFGDYISRAQPGDPGLPEALLERGRIRAEQGEPEAALEDFDRVLREDLGISPLAAEWEAALLERGRALLALGQRETGEESRGRRLDLARRSFAEYLERYAEAGESRAGAVEAAWLLARAATEQGDWEGAVAALERAAVPEPAHERAAAFQREARFLRGDLLLALGRPEEAERAYAKAARLHADSPERLWGLLGRARALARLGRLDEARREARAGRALFDQGRAAFDASFGGRGKDYWSAALEVLEKEVR